jgi:glycerophosphoryl diester phosphodiesterase
MRILGHRGASHDAPENTLASFELALQQGADGVELDARLCASGEAVVFHDETLERLTGRPGAVRDTPWSVLRTLEVRGKAGGRAPIPLLSQVLERLPRSAWINVELKAERWSDSAVADVAGALLESGGHAEHVVVSSFQPLCLLRLALRFPGFAGAPPRPRPPDAAPDRFYLPLLGRDAVHPAVERVDRVDVERWHRSGREVAVWTVDDPEQARRLREWGVDSCITNRPGELRAALTD